MEYFRIHLSWSDKNEKSLDLLMELGLINAYENGLDTLSIIDESGQKKKILALMDDYFPGQDYRIEDIEDQDWNSKWKENFQPLPVGNKFWITAPWHEVSEIPDGRHHMIINPGQAFGTGTHESTQMLMMLLENYIPRGKTVIDIGCGSGILSIAASMLGAASVYAVDYDEVFLENMSENIQHNKIKNVTFKVGDVFRMKSFPGDVCLMNIEKHIIRPALAKMTEMGILFNELFLSGLLAVDYEDAVIFTGKAGYNIHEKVEKGEWIGLYCVPK